MPVILGANGRLFADDSIAEVQTPTVYPKQAAPSSQRPYSIAQKETHRDDRQKLRRKELLQAELAKAVLGRIKDVRGPSIRIVTDEDYFSMRFDPKFTPLSKYAHKLTTPTGKVVRPVLAGEVGMYAEKICTLEAGERNYRGGILNAVQPSTGEKTHDGNRETSETSAQG